MDIRSILQTAHETSVALHGTTIQVVRGASKTRTFKATKGQKFNSEYGENGEVVTTEYLDFLIPPEEYDFGQGPVEPERGDVLIEVVDYGPRELRWETMSPPGSQEKVWRWSDAHESFLRVHTTLMREDG